MDINLKGQYYLYNIKMADNNWKIFQNLAMQNIITNICLKRQLIIFDSIDDLQYLHIVCSLIIEYDYLFCKNNPPDNGS